MDTVIEIDEKESDESEENNLKMDEELIGYLENEDFEVNGYLENEVNEEESIYNGDFGDSSFEDNRRTRIF